MNVNRQQVLPPFDNQVMEQVVQENAAEGGYQVGLIITIIIITTTTTMIMIMIMIMIIIITAFSGSRGGGRRTG